MSDPVVAYYDRLARDYDRRFRAYTAATIRALAATFDLNGDERLLDVPCGTGALEEWMKVNHPGVEAVGVDGSAAMLARAREKHLGGPCTWLQSDVHQLPLETASFERVVCANSFHCFDRPLEVLAEFRRVLRPGGRLTILDWCDDYWLCKLCGVWFRWFDPASRRMYTALECRRLLQSAGFTVRREHRFRHRVAWGLMLFECERG